MSAWLSLYHQAVSGLSSATFGLGVRPLAMAGKTETLLLFSYGPSIYRSTWVMLGTVVLPEV
jgi:hypothetical protein